MLPFIGPLIGAIGGGLGKIFGGGGSSGGKGGKLDPTSLVLGLLGSLGGDDKQFESFRSPGSMTDPIQSLQTALNATHRLGQGLTERAPVQLRSSYVQRGPSPVQIPGLGFQIGGGLGIDPALDNPSLLTAQDRGNPFKYDPFQSLTAAGANGNPGDPGSKPRGNQPATGTARRRNP